MSDPPVYGTLTAKQVGLTINRLSKNNRFQDASYGFTVFSIFAPLIGITIIMLTLCGLFTFNIIGTVSFQKEVEMKRKAWT
jgi:hypothetical protein